MLLEFRSPVLAALFECSKDSVVGDLADLFGRIERLFPELMTKQQEEGELIAMLESNEPVSVQLIKAKLDAVFPPPVDAEPLLLTLYWMRKPLLRSSTLQDHNKNERTKLVVMVGLEDAVDGGSVALPDASACKQVQHVSAQHRRHQQELQVIAKAKTTVTTTSSPGLVVAAEDLSLLSSLPPINHDALYKMASVCTASDPDCALQQLLSSDASFRSFADEVLLVVKRARRTADAEGGVEYIPLAQHQQ